MWDLLAKHALEVIFGVVATVTSIVAVYYARKSLQLDRESHLTDPHRSVHVFLSREAMISSLLRMYDDAEHGDCIWAQTVSMRNYPGKVRDKVLKAAGNGVTYRFIVNESSPAVDEFLRLFDPVKSAEIVRSSDNKIRVQGLSDREVVIAFPTLTTYTAVRFTDRVFVKIMRGWFDSRFETIADSEGRTAGRNPKIGDEGA